MWATCHTPDCGNADIPIDVGSITYEDDQGVTQTMPVFCSSLCGNEITDLSETQPAMPPDPDADLVEG